MLPKTSQSTISLKRALGVYYSHYSLDNTVPHISETHSKFVTYCSVTILGCPWIYPLYGMQWYGCTLTFSGEVTKVCYVSLHVCSFCKIHDLNNPHNSSKKLLVSLFPDQNSWTKTSSSAFSESLTFLQIFYYVCKYIIRFLFRRDLQEFY